MAATNVQAFSGDVEISSNLAVATNELFVDTESGRVGIGTTSPLTPLHISSTNEITSSPAASSVSQMRYGTTNSTVLFGVSSTAGHISAYDTSNFATNRDLCLNANGGNVGIGTDDAAQILHVQKPSESSGNQIGLLISDDQGGNSSTTLPAIGFSHNSGTIFRGGIQMVNESNNLEKGMIFRCGRSGSLGGFATHPLNDVPERVRINRNGYVGINTSSPSHNLHVNGNLRGNKVFSQSNSPSIDGNYRNYYYINDAYHGWGKIMSRNAGQLNGWAVAEFARKDGGISSFAYRLRGNTNFQFTFSSNQLRIKKNPSSGMSTQWDVLAI